MGSIRESHRVTPRASSRSSASRATSRSDTLATDSAARVSNETGAQTYRNHADVNECEIGAHQCDPRATCEDRDPLAENGRKCVPSGKFKQATVLPGTSATARRDGADARSPAPSARRASVSGFEKLGSRTEVPFRRGRVPVQGCVRRELALRQHARIVHVQVQARLHHELRRVR